MNDKSILFIDFQLVEIPINKLQEFPTVSKKKKKI